MKLPRRNFLHLTAGAAALSSVARSRQRAVGSQMRILHANTSREIDAVFATFVRACRLAGAISRMSATYQHVTVKHIHQQVNVTQGGQAVVAGDKVMSRTRGRRRSDGGGMVKNER
jgi:hypothetical protein